jgi:hypothetical protein
MADQRDLPKRPEQKLDERVVELAAGLWNSAGRTGGRDLDFWLMAEQMVRQDLEWHQRREKGRHRR